MCLFQVVAQLTETEKRSGMTLLQWIAGPKVQEALRRIASVCSTTFEMLDRDKLDTVKANISSAKQEATNVSVFIVKYAVIYLS